MLSGVARELRALRLHRRGIRRWAVVAVAAFVLLQVKDDVAAFAPYSLPVLGLLLVAAIFRSIQVARADQLDYAEAARVVEDAYPDLKQALRTAAEQQPGDGGRFNFLQLRVIRSALQHANLNDWKRQPKNRTRYYFAGHAAIFALALALTLGPALLLLENKEFPVPQITLPHASVTVSPGNAEVERGSVVAVSATFAGHIPREAQLTWRQPDGKTGSVAMGRSLSDPIFAVTLPPVNTDVTYSVNYTMNKLLGGNTSTDQFTLKVFDQPALLTANATLDYPAFTGLPKKTIPDTRRVSAITGTQLQYDFTMNKPMKDVTLTDDKGNKVAVTASNPQRTQFTANLTITQTENLTMHLADDANRPNPAPTDIRITAVPVQRPVVAVTFPVRDQRVSPLEEVHVQATARDQFGLLDYGLAYSVGADDPQFLSLKSADAAKPATPANATANATPGNTTNSKQASFADVINLEAQNVEPGELVTWFAWADDTGPDGKVRRTTSDLAFAEVRPLESIFHEDDAAASAQAPSSSQQQQQQGANQGQNPTQSLLQLERQISVATWNIKSEDQPDATFKDDVGTLKDSQDSAITQLATAAEEATTPAQQAAAADAAKFMQQADAGLAAAATKNSLDPLTAAWSGAQGAYQALLRMQGREFRVSQNRNQGQGQQQSNPLQQQLDQLQFRQQQNRYQTQNSAQAPAQQQNQMQAQSRLNDLARRQQDLNQRLQEMQTALAAAQDQQQRDQIQQELQRLQEEQQNMLNDLDQAGQNLDQLQANQQTDQARQQLDQARQNMRQAGQQLAQNQVSQALAAGTRANQALQQTQQALHANSASQFANEMSNARQEARDLSNQQQQDGQQLTQLAQNPTQALDTTAQRQALSQNFNTQAGNLSNLMTQLQQIAQDSQDVEPGLNRQLYDLLRQQSSSANATVTDLKNGSQMLNNGALAQTLPLQNDAARNLDELRQGVERAAQSVVTDDTSTLRYAQNELNNLTQQLLRDQPATSDQFRNAAQSAAPGTSAANPGSAQNPSSGNNAQNGNNGGNNQTAQDANSNSFRDAGNAQDQGNQAGPGQQPGQGRGRQGAQGQGQGRDNNQTAQDNGNGTQPGQGGQGQGRQGQRGQGQGQAGAQVAENSQGNQPGQGQGQGNDQTAQDNGGQPGQGGQGQGQGRQGGRGRQGGQGQGGGQVAQNGQGGQPGQGQSGQGQGRQGGRQGGGQGSAGQAGTDQANGQDANQLAAQDQPVDQPFDTGQADQPGNGGRGGRAGRGGRGGQRGGNQAANGGAPQLAQQLGGNAGGGGGQGSLTTDATGGPLTGNNTFADWADRLRTVQNLLDDPTQRQQIADALAQAQDLRSNYIRHSQLPQWDTVSNNVISPLSKVSDALRQQLTTEEQPEALEPVDQDPCRTNTRTP